MKKTRFIQKEEEKLILSDFEKGMNTVELAKKYDRNNTTIGKLLKRNGLKARNIRTKLTKEKVFEAHKLYTEELLTTEELGKIYKVDANTIANSFRRFNLLVRANGHIPGVRDEDLFKVIDTEEKAYFLGLLMADGSIQKDKASYTLSLELQEEDKDILYSFADFLGLPKERVRRLEREKTGSITYVVVVGSLRFCQHLIDKGVIPGKTGNKKIPTGVPKNLLRHTLRGLIDGDGSILKDSKQVILYGSGDMVYQVADYLYKELSLSRKPMAKKYKNVVPRMTSYSDDYEKITSYLYKDSNLFIKRKNPYYNENLSI